MSDTAKQNLPFIKFYTGDCLRLTVALTYAESDIQAWADAGSDVGLVAS